MARLNQKARQGYQRLFGVIPGNLLSAWYTLSLSAGCPYTTFAQPPICSLFVCACPHAVLESESWSLRLSLEVPAAIRHLQHQVASPLSQE